MVCGLPYSNGFSGFVAPRRPSTGPRTRTTHQAPFVVIDRDVARNHRDAAACGVRTSSCRDDGTREPSRVVFRKCFAGASVHGVGHQWHPARPDHPGLRHGISVASGGVIDVKVRADAPSYRMDVYRMGYYGGAGARRVAGRASGASRTPDCIFDERPSRGLLKLASRCRESVASDAVSGIYFSWCAPMARPPPGVPTTPLSLTQSLPRMGCAQTAAGRSSPTPSGPHTACAGTLREPRPAASTSSSATLAHLRHPLPNHGHHLASVQLLGHRQHLRRRLRRAAPACRLTAAARRDKGAARIQTSYNRPFATRAYRAVNMPFNSELPAVRWLERNGSDVSYWSGVDADRYASRLASPAGTRHRLYLSVGHDEYWSGAQRAAVTAARDHGMHLAFFSGNEVYWRTRWEEDAAGRSHRTLVVYKETQDVKKIDPQAHEWTGTWRDGRTINPLGAMRRMSSPGPSTP